MRITSQSVLASEPLQTANNVIDLAQGMCESAVVCACPILKDLNGFASHLTRIRNRRYAKFSVINQRVNNIRFNRFRRFNQHTAVSLHSLGVKCCQSVKQRGCLNPSLTRLQLEGLGSKCNCGARTALSVLKCWIGNVVDLWNFDDARAEFVFGPHEFEKVRDDQTLNDKPVLPNRHLDKLIVPLTVFSLIFSRAGKKLVMPILRGNISRLHLPDGCIGRDDGCDASNKRLEIIDEVPPIVAANLARHVSRFTQESWKNDPCRDRRGNGPSDLRSIAFHMAPAPACLPGAWSSSPRFGSRV